jgi:transcriptional regulator with PAS, ATPase and Fis domain
MFPETMISGGICNWSDQLNASITVCDRKGIVVYMNKRAIAQFQKYGGETLVGQSLIECHPEPARTKLIEMLQYPIENIYTTEKNGVKKIIIQKPWIQEDDFCGVVEISFELPPLMVNHIRQ